MTRRSERDTFGGVDKIDAEPETIAQAILGRTKTRVSVPQYDKDGKPVLDTGTRRTSSRC